MYWRDARPRGKQRGITVQPPGKKIDIEWHRTFICDFDLWLILEGRAALVFEDGEQQEVNRGSCIWLRPGMPFDFIVAPHAPLHTAWIHFDLLGESGEPMDCHRVTVPPVVQEIRNIQFFEVAFRHLTTLKHPLREGSREVEIDQGDALLFALLCEYELAGCQPERMDQASLQYRQIVESVNSWLEHHPDRPVTAGELAKRYGYSLPHFSRIFRKTVGKSPTAVIIEARIRQAKRLLLDSTLNISEVAASLGYEEVFYFSKQFKKATGLSPLTFRKMNQ